MWDKGIHVELCPQVFSFDKDQLKVNFKSCGRTHPMKSKKRIQEERGYNKAGQPTRFFPWPDKTQPSLLSLGSYGLFGADPAVLELVTCADISSLDWDCFSLGCAFLLHHQLTGGICVTPEEPSGFMLPWVLPPATERLPWWQGVGRQAGRVTPAQGLRRF